MNKKTTINIIGFIVMLLIIIILSLAYVYGTTTNLDSGTCISNGTRNGTQQQICAKSVQCSSIKQNFSCNPQAVSCNYNLSCPQPSIINKVNSNFTYVSQPVISRDSLDKYSWVIWIVILGLVGLILWQTGIFNNLKRGTQKMTQAYTQDYSDMKETASKAARGFERKAKQEIEDIP